MLASNTAPSPPGKSDRPTDPAKRVSPQKTTVEPSISPASAAPPRRVSGDVEDAEAHAPDRELVALFKKPVGLGRLDRAAQEEREVQGRCHEELALRAEDRDFHPGVALSQLLVRRDVVDVPVRHEKHLRREPARLDCLPYDLGIAAGVDHERLGLALAPDDEAVRLERPDDERFDGHAWRLSESDAAADKRR